VLFQIIRMRPHISRAFESDIGVALNSSPAAVQKKTDAMVKSMAIPRVVNLRDRIEDEGTGDKILAKCVKNYKGKTRAAVL
jgi:hypothetical protein